jgi:hypothetical protein
MEVLGVVEMATTTTPMEGSRTEQSIHCKVDQIHLSYDVLPGVLVALDIADQRWTFDEGFTNLSTLRLGVMRFLQTEWHRHERDRNAWEIERAEMKAKIAKLEGETRSHKKLQVDLSKRIQMLEIVLKREREKAKSTNLEEKSPKEDENKDLGKQDPKLNVKVHAESMRRECCYLSSCILY